MTRGTLGLILASVLASAVAQVLLKAGVSPRGAAAPDGLGQAILGFLMRPAVLAGLALYGLGALLWLGALSRTELSRAYPFVSLGFVLTAVAGHVLFGEEVGLMRAAGVALIVTGVLLVARS